MIEDKKKKKMNLSKNLLKNQAYHLKNRSILEEKEKDHRRKNR